MGHNPSKPRSAFIEVREHVATNGYSQLGCGCWRGSAEIGDQVADGDVDLVTNGANDGDCALEHRPRDDFLVECPQIFERATATAADDQVNTAELSETGVDTPDSPGDFTGGALTLAR